MNAPLGSDPLKSTLFKGTVSMAEPARSGAAAPQAQSMKAPAPDAQAAAWPTQPSALEPTVPVVAFQVGPTRLGIDIRHVSCVVRMAEITRMPRSPDFVEGILDLRGRIVPVISMHRLLGTAHPRNRLQMYVIVAEAGSQPMGLTVDSMTELRDIDRERLERPAHSTALAAILSHLAKLDDGILFLLDLDKLAGLLEQPDRAAGLALGEPDSEPAPLSSEQERVLKQRAAELRLAAAPQEVSFKRFFTFALGDETYAMEADRIERVLMVGHVVSVPGAPDHFVGLMNYAGELLWVLDAKKLLGLPPSLSGNDERVVVMDYPDVKFGLLVDAAHDLCSFPVSALRPVLAGGEKGKDEYVTGEIYWRDELIAVVDFASLGTEPEPEKR